MPPSEAGPCEASQKGSRGAKNSRVRATVRITEKAGAVIFTVRVQPRARRDEIAGEYQDGLKIRLTAPPVDDRANEGLRRLLAGRLKVPLAAVRIASGERARTKRVEVSGATAAQVRDLALGKPGLPE